VHVPGPTSPYPLEPEHDWRWVLRLWVVGGTFLAAIVVWLAFRAPSIKLGLSAAAVVLFAVQGFLCLFRARFAWRRAVQVAVVAVWIVAYLWRRP
jgi:hypothetical protein